MFQGSLVALVTPMDAQGQINWDQLANLVELHVAAKSGAIVAVGTTGESATLDVAEHSQVIRFVIEQAAGRIAVIAGTGANSTAEAIELTQLACDAKADACLLVTPYYNRPTQEGLYQHYKKIAESVAIPQILYNVPGRTACDLLNETVDRLAGIDNIVGIKDATGDMERGKVLIDQCADRLAIFSGDDGTFVDLMRLGAQGNISVTANVAPQQMADVCAAALAQDFARAEELNQPLEGLHQSLFCEANPIPVKYAMHQMGLIGPGIRLPLTPLSESYHDKVNAALKQAGLIASV